MMYGIYMCIYINNISIKLKEKDKKSFVLTTVAALMYNSLFI